MIRRYASIKGAYPALKTFVRTKNIVNAPSINVLSLLVCDRVFGLFGRN